MADIERLRKNLEDRGIRSSYFATAQAAADYLDRQIDGTTVGIGGSMTVKAMGLYPRLSAHNRVVWHWEGGGLEDAAGTEVYLTSANGAAPKNAQRLGRKTPCAVKADRCYDCKSPERICRGLSVIWGRPTPVETMEVVLIGEELGM